jgi:hypothetical protein
MHEILWFVFPIFLASFNKRRGRGPEFKKKFRLRVKFLYINGFSPIPRYRQKRTVSLRVFSKNASFHSTYLPETLNSNFSLNTLCTADSAQFYSTFSPTIISWTLHFRQKREVWRHFFAENAENDQKIHSYEDNAKLAPYFWRQRSAMFRAFSENGEW